MKKKIIIIVSAIICACILVTAIISGICISKSKKTTTIAFYDLPEAYTTAIKQQIENMNIQNIKFSTLTEKDILSKNFNKEIHILFTFNDANTKVFSDNAIALNRDILSRIPSTIKNSSYFKNSKNETVIMPVVMDNFETSVLRTTRTKYGIQWPETFNGLQDFGKDAKEYYLAPLVITGAQDINVLSLFTEVIIAFGGQKGYETVKEQLQKSENFDDLLKTEITDSKLTVEDALNSLKELQDKGYLISSWTSLKEKDTYNLIEDNRIGAIFMNLSENRRKIMPNIQYYEILTFPVETEFKELSVQPVVIGLSFKETNDCNKILTILSTEEVQTELSIETKLGPAMLRGSSFDIQADEARYLAAATKGGAVPDLGTASYRLQEQRHNLAENIRKLFE